MHHHCVTKADHREQSREWQNGREAQCRNTIKAWERYRDIEGRSKQLHLRLDKQILARSHSAVKTRYVRFRVEDRFRSHAAKTSLQTGEHRSRRGHCAKPDKVVVAPTCSMSENEKREQQRRNPNILQRARPVAVAIVKLNEKDTYTYTAAETKTKHGHLFSSNSKPDRRERISSP